MESTSSVLPAWTNFYVMIGSSAAALTGLMFVVITLVRGEEQPRSSDGIATFSTPTVMHFSASLLIAAIMTAPWHLFLHPALLVGVIALCGLAYLARVAYRTRRLKLYQADVEDWVWYSVFPFISYGAMLASAIFLDFSPVRALFGLAAGIVLLIFIGIRNAWDVVTFLAVRGSGGPQA